MKKRYILILGFVCLLIFIIFSYLVHKDIFTAFDFDTTVKIQDKIPRKFDTVLSLFSLIGSLEIVTLILLVVFALLRRLRGIIVLLFLGLLHIPELFGKTFVDHPGPPFMFIRYDIPFLFPSSYVQPGSSYPSGHSARAIFISIVLGYLISNTKLQKNQKYIIYLCLILFDVVMLVSRVYLAEHWTSDVIGGSFLGAAFALFSLVFL